MQTVPFAQRRNVRGDSGASRVVEIDDTIQVLVRMRESVDKWAPRTTTRPDALIADLNDLYVSATENRDFDELFACDDVGGPSITLLVSIDAEFDLKKVMENMRARLQIIQPGSADEIGTAGIVWSHGRYDFVYDHDAGLLRISHKYSHRQVDTKSVSSIVKRMIDHALEYLREVKASVQEHIGDGETE
jgi:hypothetical protein